MFKGSSLIFKIAYENLWRRKFRTMVVVLMISIALAVLTFISGLYDGWVDQMVRDTLESDTGYITIYKTGYRLSEKVTDSINDPDKVANLLKVNDNVKYFYARLKNDGMISSARYSQGVRIMGIEIEKEENASNLKRSLRQGAFSFTPGKKEVILGEVLANELKVKLKNKVVLMGQAKDKSIASAAYRVVGIVRTNNPAIDKFAAFIPLEDAQKLFLLNNDVSQFSVVLKNEAFLEDTKKDIQQKLGNQYEIFTWKELFKGLEWMQKMIASYMSVAYSIIFVIVAIGIFNIVLISILERVRELGIMMAMGTRFFQIARMIIWESIMIGALGFIFGSLFGFLLLLFFNIVGLDLSMFSKGLETFGMAAVIRPIVLPEYFLRSAIAVFLTSFIAALWPIRILKKLKPIQAIHFM
ncbi:MAG: ABC transporter permease [Candidatus Margulisbacteria bacterium]|nr:ABC transporter permease [Candidatus Margulisiibacteriota bacterium]